MLGLVKNEKFGSPANPCVHNLNKNLKNPCQWHKSYRHL